MSTSFKQFKFPSFSTVRNKSWNSTDTHLYTSRHKRSIRSLWVDDPVNTAELLECCSTMYRHTSTFSPPRLDLTWSGTPYLLTASVKQDITVEAILLTEERSYTIVLENPSMPPCVTILHLINLWCPSICQSEFGPWTWYTRLRIVTLLLMAVLIGSTLWIAPLALARGTHTLSLCKCPINNLSPALGCDCLMDHSLRYLYSGDHGLCLPDLTAYIGLIGWFSTLLQFLSMWTLIL